MTAKRYNCSGFAWLELLLVLAFLALVIQVFPSAWRSLVWAVDVRNWSRGVWMTLNFGVVLVLFGIRFGPGLLDASRKPRKRVARECEQHEKQLTAKEERELYERMREARKRQVV